MEKRRRKEEEKNRELAARESGGRAIPLNVISLCGWYASLFGASRRAGVLRANRHGSGIGCASAAKAAAPASSPHGA